MKPSFSYLAEPFRTTNHKIHLPVLASLARLSSFHIFTTPLKEAVKSKMGEKQERKVQKRLKYK